MSIKKEILMQCFSETLFAVYIDADMVGGLIQRGLKVSPVNGRVEKKE